MRAHAEVRGETRRWRVVGPSITVKLGDPNLLIVLIKDIHLVVLKIFPHVAEDLADLIGVTRLRGKRDRLRIRRDLADLQLDRRRYSCPIRRDAIKEGEIEGQLAELTALHARERIRQDPRILCFRAGRAAPGLYSKLGIHERRGRNQ